MDYRFRELGRELAQDISNVRNIPLTDEFVRVCQKYKWMSHLAELNCDQAAALSLQEEANAELRTLVERLAKETENE